MVENFNYKIPKSNYKLRKLIENSNWNFILQVIRMLQRENELSYKAGLIQAEIDNTMGVLEENSRLMQENEKLKNNWNELKKYMIKEQARIVIENTDEDEFVYTELLNKIQELEKTNNE